jgi:hypothetical protein
MFFLGLILMRLEGWAASEIAAILRDAAFGRSSG